LRAAALASSVRSAASAYVFGNDLRLEREHLGVRWVDRNLDPVSIRAAEGLNAREVLEAPIVLRAKKRLIHEKPMRVAVKENSWASIALHLLGKDRDVFVIPLPSPSPSDAVQDRSPRPQSKTVAFAVAAMRSCLRLRGVILLIVFTVVASLLLLRFWEVDVPPMRVGMQNGMVANIGVVGGLLLLLQNVR
jgi:hypothetical protein